MFYVIPFLCNFALTWLEHLHHFLNFCCNFHCNALWHCKYAIFLDLTRCDIHSSWLFLSSVGGVAKSYITVIPPVMCMDWLCWQYNHVADVVPPLTALVILLPKWHRHVNIQCFMQSKRKMVKYNWYWRDIRSNQPIWNTWTNCWHMT